MRYTVELNRARCVGAGFCKKLDPKTWDLDDAGKSVLLGSRQDGDSMTLSLEMDKSQITAMKKAALVCPSYAINIKDEAGKSVLKISPSKKGAVTIRAHYDSMKDWVMDKKGFFTIKPFPSEGVIRVRYYDAMHRLKIVIEGTNAEEIYNTIVRKKLVSRLDHAAYIGSELQKAEIAMKRGMKFIQDSPLE